MRHTLAPLGLCAIAACSMDFLPPSAVVDLRVIGARVEVEGNPARPNPSPGERIEVSVLVTDRGAPDAPELTPPELTWSFVACVPAPTRLGPQICGAPITPCDGCTGDPPADPLAFPVIGFEVPSKEELDAMEATDVLLQGVVCSSGRPSSSEIQRFISGETEDLVACVDDEGAPTEEEGRFVTIQIPIEPDPEDPNLNPEILSVQLNGKAWPPPYDQSVPRAATQTGCRSDLDLLTDEQRADHPRAGSSPSTIELSVTAEDPDSVQSFTIDGEVFTEEIQVSWLADGGAFEVSFSFIDEPANAGEPASSTQWQAPAGVDPEGQLVRFNFVIRDGRGGLDRVERGLCVLR